MLRAVKDYNSSHKHCITSVLCPGLGTFYGKVPPKCAANMMALAYNNAISIPQQITWSFATERQIDVPVTFGK